MTALAQDRASYGMNVGVVCAQATYLIDVRAPKSGSPYKTVQVNNFNKLHVIAPESTWRKIRCLQSKTGRYFQTCIALQGLPEIRVP